MPDLTVILIRTLFIYFVVFLVMRFMGKREIGKLTVFDLVISVMIAEIAVLVIEDTKRPIVEGIVPMLGLLLVQIGIAWVTMKNRMIRHLFDGKPSVIINRGRVDREVMRKQRYNLDDMMLQLRENQIAAIDDVEFAILETSGKLSVIRKERPDDYDEKSASDIDKNPFIPPKYRFETLPVPLIMDGKVLGDNLVKLEKNRFWLKSQLEQKGVKDTKDVFLCTLDHKGRLYVSVKN
ncbi:DUF421 domain-containing protein [Paenibacillus tarimensis]